MCHDPGDPRYSPPDDHVDPCDHGHDRQRACAACPQQLDAHDAVLVDAVQDEVAAIGLESRSDFVECGLERIHVDVDGHQNTLIHVPAPSSRAMSKTREATAASRAGIPMWVMIVRSSAWLSAGNESGHELSCDVCVDVISAEVASRQPTELSDLGAFDPFEVSAVPTHCPLVESLGACLVDVVESCGGAHMRSSRDPGLHEHRTGSGGHHADDVRIDDRLLHTRRLIDGDPESFADRSANAPSCVELMSYADTCEIGNSTFNALR